MHNNDISDNQQYKYYTVYFISTKIISQKIYWTYRGLYLYRFSAAG